jgi:hypothetical protein
MLAFNGRLCVSQPFLRSQERTVRRVGRGQRRCKRILEAAGQNLSLDHAWPRYARDHFAKRSEPFTVRWVCCQHCVCEHSQCTCGPLHICAGHWRHRWA